MKKKIGYILLYFFSVSHIFSHNKKAFNEQRRKEFEIAEKRKLQRPPEMSLRI